MGCEDFSRYADKMVKNARQYFASKRFSSARKSYLEAAKFYRIAFNTACAAATECREQQEKVADGIVKRVVKKTSKKS